MKYIFLLIMVISSLHVNSQEFMPLYSDSVPNAIPGPDQEKSETTGGIERVSKVRNPGINIFLPAKETATGEAVIIYPGGGYGILAIAHEGYDVAKRFNEAGIAAFVVKYRLPDDSITADRKTAPIQDAQRAIQIVRENATRWNIKTNKIGIMGFSAGGHLASTAGTHFQKAYIPNPNRTSLRPDFMILVYPVISFSDSIGHQGSKNNLLGKNADKKLVDEYSNEKHVTDKTPRTFLVHAKDDKGVPFANSTIFADQLKKHRVPVEIYLYDGGGHGFGMNNPTSNVKWMDLVEKWIHTK
ncbi:MAG: alpha/beta hydrolase [Chitinophagaceae bacterium]|nr:MAG: alpha/beta hydrolase [Chitinophagaceae bacterium]